MSESHKSGSEIELKRPCNKGKLVGETPPLQPKHVWAIRTRLQLDGRLRDLALFNLTVDSKLPACDSVLLRVGDIAPHRYICCLVEHMRPAADRFLDQLGLTNPPATADDDQRRLPTSKFVF